jgi:hypothetical protein
VSGGFLLRLAAGALGSALVHVLLPDGADAFRGTLVVLPLVVAALGAIDREGRRRGALPADWRVSEAWPVLEAAALVLLVLLVLARRRLGLDGADSALAAGFLLLLAQRVARQVLALRPLLGFELPERPAALFFFLPLTVYLALMPWQSMQRPPDGDEPYYLLITHSLAYDLDADLTNNYTAGDWRGFLDRPLEPQPGDPVGPRGQVYSRHNEALPLLLAPAYRVGGKWGALAVMAALTAALAWITLRLAHRYRPERPGEALLAWALLAFAPPLLLYSCQVWVEVPATLLSMVALDRILDFRGRRHWGWKPWLAVALPVMLLPLVKIRFMLLAVPLVALAWWRAGRPRRPLVAISLALALVGGAILVHNTLVFGNPLKIHQVEELELTRYPGEAFLLGASGLLWDTAFGLFACAPLWLLLLPAVLAELRRRSSLLVDLAVYVGPYLAIVVPRNEWYGGWSPPFRYALVALPLLALLLVPLLAGRRRGGARLLAAVLVLATAALTVLWVIEPGWTYNFADGRTYLLDHLSQRLGADVARFFPSSVRPRAATWIWPLATLLLVPLSWWWPRRGPGPRGAAGAGRGAVWGTAVLLALAAALPWAAERLPSQRVELEDPWVEHPAGHPFPQRWVIERTRYRGGWVLREGARLATPVVPGGDEVALRLYVRFIPNVPERPIDLEVRAGERLLGTWETRTDRRWTAVTLGPVEWPAGEPLVVVAGPPARGQANGVILDRVELDWR